MIKFEIDGNNIEMELNEEHFTEQLFVMFNQVGPGSISRKFQENVMLGIVDGRALILAVVEFDEDKYDFKSEARRANARIITEQGR